MIAPLTVFLPPVKIPDAPIVLAATFASIFAKPATREVAA